MKPWLDDACALADAIRRGEVRAVDALEASLEAIAASNLNAVVYLDTEGARRQAEAVDAQIAAGKDIGPFGGVPLLVKELQDVAGWPSTQASVALRDHVAEQDSTHVARMRAGGAIIVGLAAASEFGLVAYTATKLHGVTRNPWNLERTPAGSSGGSAAAVAGGLAPLATGTDGGGSIRKPAAFCGLVGLKGTFGRIPRGPRARNGPLTSCLGVLTRSVRDTARAFDVASGYDARDPFSLPRVDGWEASLGTRDLRGLRVAVAADLGNTVLSADVRRVVTDAAEALVEATGMQRVDVPVRLPEGGGKWANAGAPGLFNDLKDAWPDCEEDLTYEIRFSMKWTSEQYRVWHAASVDRFRMQMNEAMADVFDQCDVILCATDPVEPFEAEGPMPSRVDGERVGRNNNGSLTIPANITGYPAISMPAGQSSSGLPVGLQAYARRHDEGVLLDLALAMERARPWPLTAPGAPV